MIIAIDFDGTIVEHEYPSIGFPVLGALKWMKEFQVLGARLILWTMRSGIKLTEAESYCHKNGIEFFGVNCNPDQASWTNSPKVYAHRYIDDAAFGCPLIYPGLGRPYVDWSKVGPSVLNEIILHRSRSRAG